MAELLQTYLLMHLRTQLNTDHVAFQENIAVTYSSFHFCLICLCLLLPEPLIDLTTRVLPVALHLIKNSQSS